MTEPTSVPVPDAPPPVPDDIGFRLQARLEQFEHTADLTAPRRPPRHDHDRVPVPDGEHPPSDDPAAGVADLNRQLNVLRHQLEAAFDEIDERIAALEAKAAAASARADEADHRAQVASARAANVLAAVEALTADLDRVAPTLEPEQHQRLRAAVDRLRTRLQSA